VCNNAAAKSQQKLLVEWVLDRHFLHVIHRIKMNITLAI
jgi:hypothetical protein